MIEQKDRTYYLFDRTRLRGDETHEELFIHHVNYANACVLMAYLKEDRHYHNLEHVADCLRRLPELRREHEVLYEEELIIATLYHDVVYDPQRTDNEEKSADVAVVAHPHLNTPVIREIIMATKHTGEPLPMVEQMIMADIDLAGLAADHDTFMRNTVAIRKEYVHLDDRTFWTGRIGFLKSMIARERIYYTPLYFQRYEVAARMNMMAEIDHCERRVKSATK